MTHHSPHHLHLPFFANSQMLEMFAFQFIKGLAFGLVGIFIPVFLFQSGVPLFHILLFYTAGSIFHGFTALFLARPLLHSIGLKKSFIISLILYALSFFFLHQGIAPIFLFGWALSSFLADGIYWPTHHSFVSISSDHGKTGRETAALSIVTQISTIITPFLGAILALIFGWSSMFTVAIFLIIISAFPLFLTKSPHLSKTNQILSPKASLKKYCRKFPGIRLATMAKGLDDSNYPIWNIYLFSLLGGLKLFGGLISSLAFIQTIATYLSGKKRDANQSTFSLGIKSSLTARTIAMGGFVPHIAVLSDALNGLASPFYLTPFMAKLYQQCRGKHTISLISAFEFLWHLGHSAGMILVTTAVFFFGFHAFLLSIFLIIIAKWIMKTQKFGT